MKNPPNLTPSYHYVTTHDSRIAEEQILFCESMATSRERANIAVRMAIDHHLWKKKAHAKYNRKCCLYIAIRVAWEIVSSRFYYFSNHFYMRRIRKRHEEWKTSAMTTYSRECEIYVLERKGWEFNAVLQAWGKPGVSWPMEISSFDNLVELASTDPNPDNEDYATMVEEEDR
jgi:hypothetical protein